MTYINLRKIQTVWSAVTRDPRATQRELASRCGISLGSARTALRILRLAGYIDYADNARRSRRIIVPCGEEVR